MLRLSEKEIEKLRACFEHSINIHYLNLCYWIIELVDSHWNSFKTLSYGLSDTVNNSREQTDVFGCVVE